MSDLVTLPTPEQRDVFGDPEVLHVFTTSKVFQTAPVRRRVEYWPGQPRLTVQELVDREQLLTAFGLKVTIDGQPVPRHLWSRVRPRPGHHVGIYVVPGGSGGGGGQQDSNKTLRTVLMVVVAIAAIAVSVVTYGVATPLVGAGWAMFMGAMAGAAISIGGSFAVNALLPVRIKGPEAQTAVQGAFGITGASNVMAQLGLPFTKVYGRHKVFPVIAAEPFLEYIGNDQYLRMVFCPGFGPLQFELDKLEIDGTPITAFRDVEYEVRQGYPTDPPLTLYTSDMATFPLGQLRLTTTYQVRTTAPDAERIHIAIEWPRGIYEAKTDGSIGHTTMGFAVQYRRVGVTDWIGAPILEPGFVTEYRLFYHYADGRILDYVDPNGSIIDISNQPITYAASIADISLSMATRDYTRRGYSWPVQFGPGEYEVRIARHTAEDPSGEHITEAYWTLLASERFVQPIAQKGLALIAIRIRATDQINGIIQKLSCVVTSILPDWDAASQTWIPRATRNPASHFRDVLQGTAGQVTVPNAKIDLAGLQAWHDECEADTRRCDYVIDGDSTVGATLGVITACGRGTPGRVDLKHTVIRDLPQTVPVNIFTPRTSWNYSGGRLHPDWPHGIRVPMAANELKDWGPDEIVYYSDGYDVNNASLFEVVDATGITSPDQAYKIARYHFAAAKLRPELHTWSCDFENLKCTRGDLVGLNHDVIKAGITAGRLTALQVDGSSNVTGVTVDEDLVMEAGRRVGLAIRRANGPPVEGELTIVVGTQRTVSFKTPIPAVTAPAVGDLFVYGDLGQEYLELVVRSIEYTKDLVATITAVPAAPEIHNIYTGPIPAWDPNITLPPLDLRIPPRPVVTNINSDEAAILIGPDGSLTTRVVISIAFTSGVGLVPAQLIEVRWRKAGTQSAWQQLFASVAGDAVQVSILGVEDGFTYDFLLRSVANNITSEWTEAQHFVVGKTTPPPDVPMVVLQGRILVWTPPPVLPRDFAGYLIRRHFSDRRSWEDAQPIHGGVLTDNSFPLPLEASGLTTYLVKAVDAAGNVSLNAAVIVVNLGDQVVENLIGQLNFRTLGWPGTIVNGITDVQGDLRANSTSKFWGPDDLPFWKTAGGQFQYSMQGMLGFWMGGYGKSISTGALGNLFWFEQFLTMEYRASILPTADQAGSDLVLGVAVAAESWKVEYQVAGQTLFWGLDSALFWKADTELFWGPIGATGDDWLPWPGRLRDITRQVYEIRVTAQGNAVQGAITGFLASFDAPNRTEAVVATLIAAAGTRLPLAHEYRAIKSAGLTLVADGGTAETIRILDFGTGAPFLSDGPLVQVLGVTQAPTSGTVTGQLVGY